jgi:hypothetical protein
MKPSFLARNLTIIIAILLIFSDVFGFGHMVTESNVPEIRAIRIDGDRPNIDGALDDPIWHRKDIDFAREFIQREPDEGQPATESTSVAIAYDDDAIYFAFWCYDREPDKIMYQLIRRDNLGAADAVTVRLDPYHDHQTGARFDVTSSGVQGEARIYNDTNLDYTWDAVWESAVKKQPWGWSAEIRIPFHCLRFAEKDEHTWGINLTRFIARRDESPWWAYSPQKSGGYVSKFGHLVGLQGIKPSLHLEILPYGVSAYQTEPKSISNPDGRDYMKNVGFDIKYGFSSNLIFDGAVNPDFGQVELDKPILNLSAYETYYEEKRPFFMEGADLFNTHFNVFYSRRIGRPPRGDISNPNDRHYDADFDHYTRYPKGVSILSAARITGKINGGTSIAFLNALTQEEKAEYLTTTGEKRNGIVEPMADYTVFRIQQDVLKNSNIGAIYTLVSQNERYPISSGGIDWRLLTPNGKWSFIGQSVASRRDNRDTGYGHYISLGKETGNHWLGSIVFQEKDRKLDLNRLGYLSRNDTRSAWLWIQYYTKDDWFIIRNSYNNFNISGDWNHDGVNLSKGWNFNTYIDFVNGWNLGGGFNMDYGEYDDMETRGNGLWKLPNSWSWWYSLNTDSKKKVSFSWNPGAGHGRNGDWWANWIGIDYRPAGNITLSSGINYARSFGQTIWVTNKGDSSIFADLNQDELTLRLTAGVMFTRNLSMQLSGQGYISSIDYANYRRYLGLNNYSPYALDEQDFVYRALNSTLLIRWEYRPGSTIYLVWTRALGNYDGLLNNLEFSRDIKKLFSKDAENVFLAKISYWWNP